MRTVEEKTDVLVIGGGIAGVVAAVQAARAGAATVLLDMGEHLGAGVVLDGLPSRERFSVAGRRVVAGIGLEIAQAAAKLDGVSAAGRAYSSVLVMEEACIEAGVRVRLHETVVEARSTRSAWVVRAMGKGVERIVTAREVVDCTTDADIVGAAGFARVKSCKPDAGMLAFRLGGLTRTLADPAGAARRRAEALRAGDLGSDDLPRTDEALRELLGGPRVRFQRVPGADCSTSESQTAANLDGRQSLLRLLRHIRGLGCGAKARIDWLGSRTVVRDTSRIAGESTVTDQHRKPGGMGGNFVCYAIGGSGPDRTSVAVPLGALIPRGSSRLLAAGTSIACDEPAARMLRGPCTSMATGQAAGAAAAVGALQGIPSRHVPFDRIRTILCEHGAIVPQ